VNDGFGGNGTNEYKTATESTAATAYGYSRSHPYV